MAKALLIKRSDLTTFSNISGAIDDDRIIQYISIAQDIHIQDVLGTDLLERIQSDIVDDDLTGNYLTLVTNWIKPALIHWTLFEALPFMAVQVGNAGLYKIDPDGGAALSDVELNDLIQREKAYAVYYTDRVIDYLCNNSNLFPEYTSNTNEDVSPSKDSNFVNWNID